MTKCKDCIYFSGHVEHDWIGHCGLELPDWLINLLKASDCSRQVRADSGCDLGKS